MASVHPEDLERVQAAIRSSLLDDAPFEAEYRRILPGGVVRWILSKGRTIRDHKGTALKLIGVALDVTDRKRAEEALRESEAQLRHTSGQFAIAVTAMSAIVYDYDPVTDHVERLRGLEEVTGYRPDEVPQTASWWRGQIHPDDRASMDDIDSNQDIKITEYRLRHKQGHYIWVRDAAMLLRDHAGLSRVVGCTVDISEQKRAELALREREEFYRTLGEAVPDFIWSMTADGTATYVNRRWQEYTGLSLEDLTRHNWGSLNHPEDARGLIEDWEHAARRGEPFEAEFRYRRHDGVYRWFVGRSVPLRDDTGQIAQWIGTSTDIHRLKEAETKLRRYNEELEQFAYAAAHDLQEPLRNISVFAQLLSRRLQSKLDDEAKLFLAVVEGGAQRMATLVQDLLRYTRTLDGPPDVQAIDSGSIINQVIDSFSQTISNCGAEIEVMPLPRVWIFDAHLLQLFQNLIGNAIKYRAPESPLRIRISAERQDEEWVFAVADNGIGIAPEYNQRIFGVFRRLHGREVAGTGIGLAICKRIVEHYGGRIWVESQIRRGATFRFTLPAR